MSKKIDNDIEFFKKFSELVAYSMKEFGKSRIKRAYDLGEKAFDYAEEQEKKSKRKPKVESYEINAKNQKDAIRQVKALELPEEVEKEIIKVLTKNK